MIIDSSDDEDFECTKETTPEIHDIDGGNDIFLVTEYASEIYQYLKQAEVFIFVLSSVQLIRYCYFYTRCFELVWRFQCARYKMECTTNAST